MIITKYIFSNGEEEIVFHPSMSIITSTTIAEKKELVKAISGLITPENLRGLKSEIVLDTGETLTEKDIQRLHDLNLLDYVKENVVTWNSIKDIVEVPEIHFEPFDPSTVNVEQFLLETPSGVAPLLDTLRETYVANTNKRDAIVEEHNTLTHLLAENKKTLANTEQIISVYKKALFAPWDEGTEGTKEIAPLLSKKKKMEEQLAITKNKIFNYKESNLGSLEDAVIAAKQEANENAKRKANKIVLLRSLLDKQEKEMQAKGFDVEKVLEEFNKRKTAYEKVQEKFGNNTDNPSRIKEELESLHERIVNYQKFASRNKKMPPKEELESRQRDLLAQLGFSTWGAYVMADQVTAADPVLVKKLRKTESDFRKIEEVWLRMIAEMQKLDGYMENIEEMGQLLDQSRYLTGVGEGENMTIKEIADRLSKGYAPAEELGESGQKLSVKLEDLEVVDHSTDVVHLIRIAEQVLTESKVKQILSELANQQTQLEKHLSHLSAEISEIEKDLLGGKAQLLVGIARQEAILVENKNLVSETQEKIMETLRHKSECEKEILFTKQQISDLVISIFKKKHIEKQNALLSEKENVLSRLESFLFNLFASLHNVEEAGAVPVVFDDIFTHLDQQTAHFILDKIAVLGLSTQAIIISDSDVVSQWIVNSDQEMVGLAVISPKNG